MMRPTAIKGDRAVAYYDTLVPSHVHARRRGRAEDYYLSTDEQPGLWWGAGATALGLDGEASEDEFHAVMNGVDPRSGEPLGQRLRTDGVRGFDLTFSAPKSVSVLSAICGGEIEREIVESHARAVVAVLEAIEQRATTRAGHNGIFRLDVTGLSVLLARHRTSRALEPQLHTHAVLAAKVTGVDGRWRALDATMLYRDQRSLGALYQAALRAELTARLGVSWRPVLKGQAELAGIDDRLLEGFSSRSEQIRKRLSKKVSRFTAEHGRDPSRRELGIIARDAARESRPPKQRGRLPEELRAEWVETAHALGYDPGSLINAAVPVPRAQRAAKVADVERMLRAEFELSELGREVIDVLASERSAWTLAEIQREVAARVPASTDRSARECVRTVESLADQIVSERCVDLAPEHARGAALDALQDPGIQRYTTPDLLSQEQRIVRLFHELAAEGGGPVAIGERVARGLDPEQAAAAGLVAGTGGLVVVIGPAGAGKTRVVSAAVAALHAQGRAVVGLAPWAVAAEQLSRGAGIRADTVRRFLTEHELADAPSRALELPAGGTVIVDEASLLHTGDTERLLRIARKRGYRLALVGDSRQLAAVGRSGMFDHASQIAPTVTLREVRRFQQEWEAQASLRLRECDDTVLTTYQQRGRIKSGSASEVEQAILGDWWTARTAGHSTAFTAPTNEQVRRLNQRARRRLIKDGLVADDDVLITDQGERLGAGDEIQTRQNDRSHATALGHWVRNRQRWQIEEVLQDGALRVRGRGGQLTLDPDYCHEHVELAYFTTVHSSQGLTRDIAGTIVDELSGWRSLYVGMTRGSARNTAYVVTNPDENATSVLERALRRDRADLGALRIQQKLTDEARLRTARQIAELRNQRRTLAAGGADHQRLAAIDRQLASLQPCPAASYHRGPAGVGRVGRSGVTVAVGGIAGSGVEIEAL
jgi:conjugative relaxase-like TrwC/TraI family protein